MTDKEFQSAINKLLKGDNDGLVSIYEAYIKLIYIVVYNIVGSKEDAEDITSEFFIKLIRVADTFKKGRPHKTWLVTIAKNMALDYVRKKSRIVLIIDNNNNTFDNGNTSYQLKDVSNRSVEDTVVMSNDISKAMDTLTPKEKEIIDLKLIGQFKFREIAEITKQPIGTVTWFYNQGIQKLRKCLVDYKL